MTELEEFVTDAGNIERNVGQCIRFIETLPAPFITNDMRNVHKKMMELYGSICDWLDRAKYDKSFIPERRFVLTVDGYYKSAMEAFRAFLMYTSEVVTKELDKLYEEPDT